MSSSGSPHGADLSALRADAGEPEKAVARRVHGVLRRSSAGRSAASLGRLHGKAQHRGELPRRLATYKTLLIDVESLKRRLKSAVRSENYEEAARIRDRIAELKGQGEDD